jgi:hypothetical protein
MGRPKGLPKYGGRKKGTPNKATADIKALALQYTPLSFKALAEIIEHGQSESARVSAIALLWDRAYGKAAQAVMVGGDAANPMRVAFRWDNGDD